MIGLDECGIGEEEVDDAFSPSSFCRNNWQEKKKKYTEMYTKFSDMNNYHH